MATLSDATIEAWVRWNGGGSWPRIFDIGTDTANYWFLTPFSGGEARSAIRTSAVGEQLMNADGSLPADGTLTHVAVTIDSATTTGRLYVDGVLAGAAAENTGVTLTPADLGSSTIAYLGKSFWPDPFFNGEIVEFRVYSTALSATEIDDSFVAGPDAEEAGSPDCNTNGVPDECDLASGTSQDCQPNAIPDECDIADGTSTDVDTNGVPDECEVIVDCNSNGIADANDIAGVPIHANLRHRYSFTTNPHDSVGGAHGLLMNGATISDGAVDLAGDDDYVELPIADTVAGLTDATFEAWFVWDSGINSRLFCTGANLNDWLAFSPYLDGYWDGHPNFLLVHRPDPDQWLIEWAELLTTGTLTHVAVTIDATRTGVMYLDGQPVSTNPGLPGTPADFGGATTSWIGRSLVAGDGYFDGQVLEYRVYDAALSELEVADSYTAGPDAGGVSEDCNTNGVPDECDLAEGTSSDLDGNGVPDECQDQPPSGFALQMDGNDDHVDLGSPQVLNDLASGDFTLEMWIKTEDLGRSILIGNYDGNPSWNLEIHDTFPAGHLRVYLDGEDHHDDLAVADGAWRHVAVASKVAPNGYVKIYVDGNETYSQSSGRTGYSVSHNTMLGRDARAGSHYFAGTMDEVRVWNVLRSAGELRATRGVPLTGTESGLVGYWRLDDGTGTTAEDSAADNDGTLANGPIWVSSP